uniref:BTBDG BTB/POZ domain-containing protein n=1 Tax=Crocodylus porosus TaxID=8502 RepID=A0A7M4EVC4_CROPO
MVGGSIDVSSMYRCRMATEKHVFSESKSGKDVSLKCLGFLWDLHRIYLFKSKTLSQLLITAVESSRPKKGKLARCKVYPQLKGGKPNAEALYFFFCMHWEGFAIALKNLYNTEPEVEEADVLAVLAAASVLQFPSLFQK